MIPVVRNVWQQVDGGSPRGRRAPLDHGQDETPRQRPARQPPPRRVDALKERRLRLVELGRREIVIEGRGRPVVGTSPTTKLYDRTADAISLDEIELIVI